MGDSNPWNDAEHSIESVVHCSWTNGELLAIVDVVFLGAKESGQSYAGPQVLKCENVQYFLLLEEAVADRDDFFVRDHHLPVFKGLGGFEVSTQSTLLKQLKIGQGFGEFVDQESKHFLVQTPYNSFEFISAEAPSLAGYHAL